MFLLHNTSAQFLSFGVIHKLRTQKITFSERPSLCCTAYILSTLPMCTYKVAQPPSYKIVLPCQISHLLSAFQVYMQPLVKSNA